MFMWSLAWLLALGGVDRRPATDTVGICHPASSYVVSKRDAGSALEVAGYAPAVALAIARAFG
jgi:hypothetical protein